MKSIFSPLPQHLCALCSSGEMSLAGSTVGRSVACELGLGGTTQICFNQTAVRDLAGIGSGQIAMSNFYGKTAFGLGKPYCGGYYIGAVSSPANYYLILAPNSPGCCQCQWKTTRSLTNSVSCTDGYANTYNWLNNSTHPAGNFAATSSINGFSDWYLPARNELDIVYNNRNTLPAGQGFNTTNLPAYWASTQANPYPGFDFDVTSATLKSFETGFTSIFGGGKAGNAGTRIIRRQFFSDTRLKTNIKFITKIVNLNIYSYNYWWDQTPQLGVMAQELLNSNYSNAVLKDISGFYKVDYSKLPHKVQTFIFS